MRAQTGHLSGRRTKHLAALLVWALAGGFSAPSILAAEFRQSVLQNGIYAFDSGAL